MMIDDAKNENDWVLGITHTYADIAIQKIFYHLPIATVHEA